jgi:uncharacterized membrane protein
MTEISRLPIKLLARHSDWRPEELDAALEEHVRSDAERWRWLLQMLLPALGFGFLACGVLFFFAYNWADVPKFGQLGIAVTAVVVACVLSLIPAIPELVRKMLLTASAFLVGPLFGVFGQIYQTGANAYDLLLAWCLCMVVWVVVINFAPLWVLFLTLVNVTVVLFNEQVAAGWGFVMLSFILFAINTVAALAFIFLGEWEERLYYPNWLKKMAALAAASIGTICCCAAIMGTEERLAELLYLAAVLSVFAGVGWAAVRAKELYYLTLLSLSGIAIVATIIIRFDLDTAGFLFATLWVVGGTTGSIIVLNNFRKAWHHDGTEPTTTDRPT